MLIGDPVAGDSQAFRGGETAGADRALRVPRRRSSPSTSARRRPTIRRSRRPRATASGSPREPSCRAGAPSRASGLRRRSRTRGRRGARRARDRRRRALAAAAARSRRSSRPARGSTPPWPGPGSPAPVEIGMTRIRAEGPPESSIMRLTIAGWSPPPPMTIAAPGPRRLRGVLGTGAEEREEDRGADHGSGHNTGSRPGLAGELARSARGRAASTARPCI